MASPLILTGATAKLRVAIQAIMFFETCCQRSNQSWLILKFLVAPCELSRRGGIASIVPFGNAGRFLYTGCRPWPKPTSVYVAAVCARRGWAAPRVWPSDDLLAVRLIIGLLSIATGRLWRESSVVPVEPGKGGIPRGAGEMRFAALNPIPQSHPAGRRLATHSGQQRLRGCDRAENPALGLDHLQSHVVEFRKIGRAAVR
jgi:hypothetical protein